jgi:hypothetical protein
VTVDISLGHAQDTQRQQDPFWVGFSMAVLVDIADTIDVLGCMLVVCSRDIGGDGPIDHTLPASVRMAGA